MSSGLLRKMAAIQSTVAINTTTPKSVSSLSRWSGLLRRCVRYCRSTHNIMWRCRNVRPLLSKPFQNNFGLPKSTNVISLSNRTIVGQAANRLTIGCCAQPYNMGRGEMSKNVGIGGTAS